MRRAWRDWGWEGRGRRGKKGKAEPNLSCSSIAVNSFRKKSEPSCDAVIKWWLRLNQYSLPIKILRLYNLIWVRLIQGNEERMKRALTENRRETLVPPLHGRKSNSPSILASSKWIRSASRMSFWSWSMPGYCKRGLHLELTARWLKFLYHHDYLTSCKRNGDLDAEDRFPQPEVPNNW